MLRRIVTGLIVIVAICSLSASGSYAQEVATLVIGPPPAWLGPHCVGGVNEGAACTLGPDDVPGYVGDCPDGECVFPDEDPPPDWRTRSLDTTQFVDAIEGDSFTVPRDAGGRCAEISLTGLVPTGPAGTTRVLKGEYLIDLDKNSCHLSVKRAKTKIKSWPLEESGPRLPSGIAAVMYLSRVRSTVSNYSVYPARLQFASDNEFRFWDYGPGGVTATNPPHYKHKFYWSYKDGWRPLLAHTWWKNVTTGGTYMRALTWGAYDSIYGEFGKANAWQEAKGDAAQTWRYNCAGTQVDSSARFVLRCRPYLSLRKVRTY